MSRGVGITLSKVWGNSFFWKIEDLKNPISRRMEMRFGMCPFGLVVRVHGLRPNIEGSNPGRDYVFFFLEASFRF